MNLPLTLSAAKADAYSLDTYYREGLLSWTAFPHLLDKAALAVLKPDAVVGRRLSPAISAFVENGFRPAAVAEHRFNRHSMRALWQYQLNRATLDRLWAIDRLLPACPSLVLLLIDLDATPGVPGAVRLSALKGPADPSRRRPADLRHRLRAGPTLFNFLHTADEPADVVREMCVLVSDDERRDMMLSADADVDATDVAYVAAARLEQSVPEHDLAFPASTDRLRAASRVAGPEVARVLERLLLGEEGWQAFEGQLRRSGVSYDTWDLLTLAIHTIEHDLADKRPLIPTVGIDAWRYRSAPTVRT